MKIFSQRRHFRTATSLAVLLGTNQWKTNEKSFQNFCRLQKLWISTVVSESAFLAIGDVVSGGSGRGEVSKHATYCTQGFDGGPGMEMAYGCRWPYNALCLATINPFRNRFDDRQAHILSELFESLCRLCGEQRVMNSLTTPPSFWFVFQNESSENLESLERRSWWHLFLQFFWGSIRIRVFLCVFVNVPLPMLSYVQYSYTIMNHIRILSGFLMWNRNCWKQCFAKALLGSMPGFTGLW